MHASSGSNRGMQAAEVGLAILFGGLGFVAADGLDRFLATYDPSTTTTVPTDKFTSTGAGTLANTLNVSSKPSMIRIGVGALATVVPAAGAMYVKNPFVKASLEGMTVGAGVSLFKTLWNNLLMPLLSPKDTSAGSLQKSYIARLYPAEVAAHINRTQAPPVTNAQGVAFGALSGAPEQTGVGAPDVGPFALAGDSPYPTAAEALRQATGVHGDSPYPTAAEALRQATGVHGDSPYPTAAQALRSAAGVGADWQPGPPPGSGPGPQPQSDCGCIGDNFNPFLGFIGDSQESDTLFNSES